MLDDHCAACGYVYAASECAMCDYTTGGNVCTPERCGNRLQALLWAVTEQRASVEHEHWSRAENGRIVAHWRFSTPMLSVDSDIRPAYPTTVQFRDVLFFDENRHDARGGRPDSYLTDEWYIYRLAAGERGEQLMSAVEGWRQTRIATWRRR